MVGDMTSITDVDVLQQRVESAVHTADKALEEAKGLVRDDLDINLKVEQRKAQLARKRAQRIEAQDVELREQVARLSERLEEEIAAKDRTISNLASKNEQMGERLSRAGTLVEQLESKAYAATRLAGHPNRREILTRIDRGEVRGKKRINQLAEHSDWSADEMGAQERVRNFFGRGREFEPEHDRRRREVMTEQSHGTPVPNMEGADITMEEIIALSGGGRHNRRNK
jgi:vacuolar-type H+-ATPase subunit I/STV1